MLAVFAKAFALDLPALSRCDYAMQTYRPLFSSFAIVLAALVSEPGNSRAADLSQAVVRQKINLVTVAPTITAPPKPATQGAVVRDQNVVRTGTESRAELEFTDQTL